MNSTAKKPARESMDCLPLLLPDLIFEVLLRLRVKTLTKLQCVCKWWRTLITDPRFREAHHNRFKSTPTLLSCSISDDSDTLHFSSFDTKGHLLKQFHKKHPNPDNSPTLVVATCLDFVCLRDDSNVFLCNPSTEELIALPDPSVLVSVGFGYVPSTKEFKVVRICRDFRDDNYIHSCQVFTLGRDHCWRSVADPPFEISSRVAPFANGSIHMRKDIFARHKSNTRYDILFFDLHREEWGQFAPPLMSFSFYDGPVYISMRELSGYLCMMVMYKTTKHLDLWLLKKGEWVEEYCIDLSPIRYLEILTTADPLTIEDDGNLLLQLCDIKFNELTLKHGIVYRVVKSSGEITEVEGITGLTQGDMTSLYVECFDSLKSRKRKREKDQ